MAILQAPVESSPVRPPENVKIHAPEFKGTVVDAKSVPLSSLLTFIEGGSWPVTYYSQVLGQDNATAGQDQGQNPIYQQYTRIHNLELRVTGSLNSSQESSGSNSMIITGSAMVYPFLVPNRGDMFVAATADGKEGVFIVTQSQRQTMFRESVFQIDYQLLYMTERDPVRRADLDKKTVKSVFFHKDLLQNGQNPLVIDEDHNALISLNKLHKQLVDCMYQYFYSTEFRTLLVPGQGGKTYDPFLVEIIINTINTYEHLSVQYTRQYNVQDDYALKLPSIYRAVIERNEYILKTCFRQVGKMSTGMFTEQPMMEGIRFSGLNSVVYPLDGQRNIDALSNQLSKSTNGLPGLSMTSGRSGDLTEIVQDTTQDNAIVKIKSVDPHYYVFSRAFYELDENNLSLLERFTLDHIRSRAVDAKALLSVVQDFMNWGHLEQFYYTPIIIALIRGITGTK